MQKHGRLNLNKKRGNFKSRPTIFTKKCDNSFIASSHAAMPLNEEEAAYVKF